MKSSPIRCFLSLDIAFFGEGARARLRVINEFVFEIFCAPHSPVSGSKNGSKSSETARGTKGGKKKAKEWCAMADCSVLEVLSRAVQYFFLMIPPHSSIVA